MSQGINLRPWREERRTQRQKNFMNLTVLTLLSGLAVGGFWWWSTTQAVAAIEQENQIIRDRITLIDREIREVTELREKRQQLLDRAAVIQSLQQDRPITVELLDQLARSMTDGIHITALNRQDQQIVLQGQANPSQSLSTWMRTLESQPRFGEPQLRSLTSDASGATSRFDLILPVEE